MCQRIMSGHIDNQETETTVTRPSELRLGTDDLAKGLATCSMNGLDMNGVILRNVSSMKSSCGSPKTPTFKHSKSSKSTKKKISKITLPDWLIKWQAISKELPPINKNKKITLTIPPKKNCTQNIKPDNPKAEKLIIKKTKTDTVEKNNHQNIQKIQDKNAEKNINSQKKEIVPVINMFKMLPKAKFKLKKTEMTPQFKF